MQPWKMFLSRLLMAPLAMMILNLGVAEATQKAKKQPPPLQGSAIMGEVDDDTTLDESNDGEDGGDIAVEESPSTKSKANSLKNKSKKTKKRDKKKEKLMEGFSKAEEFHKTWFNLSSPKVKASLGNLTKFCKVACTAKQCADEEIAHNCHLICPAATTKKCPDPLKKARAESSSAEQEIDEGDMAGSAPAAPPLHPHISSDLTDSLHDGDSMLMESEGEGG